MDENQNAISNGPISTTYPNGSASIDFRNNIEISTKAFKDISVVNHVGHNGIKENGIETEDDSSIGITTSEFSQVKRSAESEVEPSLPGAVPSSSTNQDKGAIEKTPPPQPQRHHNAHHNRQRNHSGL